MAKKRSKPIPVLLPVKLLYAYTSKNNTLTKNKKNDILLVENKEDFILWENIILITKDTNIVENIRYQG